MFPFTFSVETSRVYLAVFPGALLYINHPFLWYVDGGKRHSFVEKNGNKCGRGREEDREEHG